MTCEALRGIRESTGADFTEGLLRAMIGRDKIGEGGFATAYMAGQTDPMKRRVAL